MLKPFKEGLPSAADLDAVAAEDATRRATQVHEIVDTESLRCRCGASACWECGCCRQECVCSGWRRADERLQQLIASAYAAAYIQRTGVGDAT